MQLVSQIEAERLTKCAKSQKKALKRVFQGRKLVAGAGFVPRHAEILSHLSHFSSLFVYTPSLRGNTHALQFGVRFGVRWRRDFWAFSESNLLAPSKKVMGIEAKVAIEQEERKPLLRHYSLTTRGVQPQNSRTPIESGACAGLSRTPRNSG